MEDLKQVPLEIEAEQMSEAIKKTLQAHLDTHENTFNTLIASFPEGDSEVKKAATELMCDTTKTVVTPPTVSDRTSAYERNPEIPGYSYLETHVSLSPLREFEGVWARKETTIAIREDLNRKQTTQRYSLVGFGPPRKEEPKRLTLEKTPKTQS